MTKLTDRVHQDRRRLTTDTQRAELLRAIAEADKTLTQHELAGRLGYSQSYISRLTRHVHALFDIMERLHISVGELEAELPWEDWNTLVSILDLERLLRDRGYHRLTDEQLRAEFEWRRNVERRTCDEN